MNELSDEMAKRIESEKANRAEQGMRVIVGCYQKYFGEYGNWPKQITDIAPELEDGKQGLLDPWGHQYTVKFKTIPQPDGTTLEKPYVSCQPPGGKPAIHYP